jgi:hypothetical protein
MSQTTCISTLKKKGKEKTCLPFNPSKQDSAQIHNINWKSPIFWQMIDRVAGEQVGEPNLTKMVQVLQDQDPQFIHLTHQQISDW